MTPKWTIYHTAPVLGLCSTSSPPSYHMEAGSEVLRTIPIVAALIVAGLFPGMFASYVQPGELGFEGGGYGVLPVESSPRVRLCLRAGCASAVAVASGAIVAALTVQIAIAMRSMDPNAKITSSQLNIGYLISLYLLLFSVANTLVVVGFGAFAFTAFPGKCCVSVNCCRHRSRHCEPVFGLLCSAHHPLAVGWV